MDRTEHGKWRSHRITGTNIKTIVRGGPAAWNTLAKQLKEGKPFYGADDTPGMPPQLRWGQEKEEQTVQQFWLRHPEYEVTDPRFMVYPPWDTIRHKYCGCSPDRMLEQGETRSPLEVKSPYDPNIHAGYTLGTGVPDAHICQVRWAMHVAGARDAWFASFDPRDENPDTNYIEFHVQYDEAFETLMLEKLDRFLEGFLAGEEFTTAILKPKTAQSLRDMFL